MPIQKKLPHKKRIRFWFLLSILPVILTTFAGCAGNAAIVKAGIGETFVLGIGQTARITDEEMEITFKEIIGDSRCPTGVTCIWAGVASALVTIVYKNDTYTLALNQPGLTTPVTEVFFDYTLTYDIGPYPTAGEEITKKDYRLTVTVTK